MEFGALQDLRCPRRLATSAPVGIRYDHDPELYWDDALARHGYGLTAIRYVLSDHVALSF
ncbi:hypothetical protein ACWF94_07245 [Streptomyces sp. NPDC055078]